MTMNTNNMNTTTILTANDFIPFETFTSKTVSHKIPMSTTEVNIYGAIYPSVEYNYWRCGVTMDLFKRFAPGFSKKVISTFGEEMVERHLDCITMHDLTSTEKIPIESINNYRKVYYDGEAPILVGGLKTITVKKYKGRYSLEEEVPGVTMLAPSHFSKNHEAPIVEGCLKEMFPWLKNFDCSFYGYNGDTYEFYVDVTPKDDKEGHTINQTLYVNMEALLTKNPQIIIDRMTSYFDWYYLKTSRNEKKQEYYDRAVGALETPLGKMFLECVAGNTESILDKDDKPIEIHQYGSTYEYLVTFTKDNHTSVKNFHNLKDAICSMKVKMNSLLEYYGQSDIEFTTDWPNASAKFIKSGLYELRLVRIVVKDINK